MATTLGVIGGSGLYQLDGITNLHEEPVQTPYGATSSVPMVGSFGSQRVVFIPRHGKGHFINPSQINYRANIWAMKKLGVDQILSVSAVGSMKPEIKPGDMVAIDQFIDRTAGRPSTFFHDGIVAHVSAADPICPSMQKAIVQACATAGVTCHRGGSYVCIEGPRFSTRAESNIFRQWGASVIGMTNLPEAILAREAEICYATLAMATDYDCWHESEEAVTAQAVVAVLLKNVDNSRKVFGQLLKGVPARSCGCGSALQHAIVTEPTLISSEVRQRLAPLIGKYVKSA